MRGSAIAIIFAEVQWRRILAGLWPYTDVATQASGRECYQAMISVGGLRCRSNRITRTFRGQAIRALRGRWGHVT